MNLEEEEGCGIGAGIFPKKASVFASGGPRTQGTLLPS